MKREKDSGIHKPTTRRQFLKVAGIGGLSAASLYLLGCAAEAVTTTQTVTNTTTRTVTAPGGTTTVTAGTPEISWDRTVDVLVIGSGIGALPGAISATQDGSDVLIIEAADHPGGLMNLSGGHCILGATPAQILQGVTDTPEMWYRSDLWDGEYMNNKEATVMYTTKGTELYRWMEGIGMEWSTDSGLGSASIPAAPGDAAVSRRHYAHAKYGALPGVDHATGNGLAIVLLGEVERLGIPILLLHRMRHLIRPGNTGPVLGAEVETPSGTINIKARQGVLLASGSWTANEEMCKAYDPRTVDRFAGDEDMFPDGLPYLTVVGDGQLAAAEIGAGLNEMTQVSYQYIKWGTQIYRVWDPPQRETAGTGVGVAIGRNAAVDHIMMVAGDGKRWVNEALHKVKESHGNQFETYEMSAFMQAWLKLQIYPHNVWAIVDADRAEALNWPIDELANPIPYSSDHPSLFPGRVAVANSLGELATKMNIDSTAFQAEVNRYNGFVDAGVDEDFGRPLPMYKVQTPPFYGTRAGGIRHTQRNGVNVNSKVQVLEQSDQWANVPIRSVGEEAILPLARTEDNMPIIPRLYAAGEVSNILGRRRSHGTLGPYMVLSMTAGQNLAQETRLP